MMRAQDFRELAEPGTITELASALAMLPIAEHERLSRLFFISQSEGSLVAPASMRTLIEGFFGSVEAVEHQKIVKLTNLVTFEGTLFNALRSSRPMPAGSPNDLEEIVTSNEGDPFCRPDEGTPEDIFGRIKGNHAVTASNVAKYDAFHGVVIYDDHN